MNEWGFRPPLCTYSLNREPPGDGNMNEMTLPSRPLHSRNSKFGSWRTRYLSVTEASHNIESLRVNKEETFCFFET